MWVQSLGQDDPLEEEMVTHASILAWRIPWTEEPVVLWGHKEWDVTEATQHAASIDSSSDYTKRILGFLWGVTFFPLSSKSFGGAEPYQLSG